MQAAAPSAMKIVSAVFRITRSLLGESFGGAYTHSVQIKTVPEDFIVDEIPAYEPSGSGDHVFIRFTKRDLPTDVAVRLIATALGADPRAAGVAGMKDKRAVTTQTISLAPPRGVGAEDLATRARSLALEGIEVRDVARHPHKLKTGHLRGNRFSIRVRHIPAPSLSDFLARAETIAKTGVPNAFGEQRFGKEGNNADRARAIASGKEKPPRDGRLLRLLYSALQSEVFNAALAERVRRGTWSTALRGDVLKKTDTGGLFVCTDEQEDQARAARQEVSATGPIVGPKMMRADGEPGEIETAACRAVLGDAEAAAWDGVLGEGTRRPLRLFVSEMRVTEPICNSVADATKDEEMSRVVEFVLPKGAFATTVLANLMDKTNA